MGNHTTISIAGASGHFELNVFRPVIVANALQVRSPFAPSPLIHALCAAPGGTHKAHTHQPRRFAAHCSCVLSCNCRLFAASVCAPSPSLHSRFTPSQSIRLLGDGMRSFAKNCVVGIQPNLKRIDELMKNSLMLVTGMHFHSLSLTQSLLCYAILRIVSSHH